MSGPVSTCKATDLVSILFGDLMMSWDMASPKSIVIQFLIVFISNFYLSSFCCIMYLSAEVQVEKVANRLPRPEAPATKALGGSWQRINCLTQYVHYVMIIIML